MPKSKAAAKDYGDLKCCDSQFEEAPIDRRWDGLNIKKLLQQTDTKLIHKCARVYDNTQ